MSKSTQPSRLPTGIRRHQSSGYIVDITYHGNRTTKTFPTLEAAVLGRLELIASIKAQATQPEPIESEAAKPKPWTLQDAFDRTCLLYWQGKGGGLSSMCVGRRALAFFGKAKPVREITSDKIGDYFASLLTAKNYRKSGAYRSGTLRRYLFALSRILRTALEHGQLDALPKMPRIKSQEGRIRFISVSEEKKLLSACPVFGGKELSDVVQCLLYTGLRTGELWRLQKSDINADITALTVWESKSGRARTIPIVHHIRDIIVRRLAEQAGSKLFPYNNFWLRHRWLKIKEYMALSADAQFVPHILRHTCATRLARGGVSLRIVKEWLGHADIQTTMRYAHFSPSDLVAAAKAFDDERNKQD